MSRSRTAAYIACVLALGGCASAKATTAADVDRVIVTSDAGMMRTREEIVTGTATVGSKPGVVLPILRDSYGELGIKAEILDPSGNAGGRVGNRYFVKSFRLGDAPLSRYLDCGTTLVGPGADNYKVTMSVISLVSAIDSGSTVETRVGAHAADPAGSSGSLSCHSTGMLELLLHRVLVRRLGE